MSIGDEAWWPLQFKETGHGPGHRLVDVNIHLEAYSRIRVMTGGGEDSTVGKYRIWTTPGGRIAHCEDLLELRCFLIQLAKDKGLIPA